MASSKATCLLCLSTKKNTINFNSDNGKELNIISILSTHFWFSLDEIKLLSQNICYVCWKKTESFHEFYQSIRAVHKKFETVFVKIEEDLDIEDDGETYQPVQVPHDNFITEFFKIENIQNVEEDESSNSSVCEIAHTNSIDTETRAFDSLLKRTQNKYLQIYRQFLAWKTGENIDEDCFSEAVMLEYFHFLKSKYKPSTLWSHFTMLRTTIQRNNNIDINYPEVTSLLKKSAVGFRPQKYFFQPDELQRFFSEANDTEFLVIKVMMIFLMYGVTRTDVLVKVGVNDVCEQGSVFVIKTLDPKTKSFHLFTVENEYAACFRKYIELRPSYVTHDRFFLTYLKGKCTAQTVGLNKFRSAPKAIANFLNLKDAECYTCFSFPKHSIANKRKIGGLNSEEINLERSTEASVITRSMAPSTNANAVTMPSTVSTTENEICEDGEAGSLDLLPEKSREKYVRTYDHFMAWKIDEEFDKECFSKEVLLEYFNYLKPKYKPPSLWARFSMLRAVIQKSHNVDITYPEIKSFLKTSSFAYIPRKCAVFQPDEIQRFLREASDNEFLAFKVLTIFGIFGILNADTLTKIDVSDVIEQGSVFVINIPDTKPNVIRSFIVENEYAVYVQKYKELRPENVTHERFFINYQKGKCTAHPFSKNKLLTVSKVIAKFLNLKDAENYSLLSFRQKSLKRGMDSLSALNSNTEEGMPKKRKFGDVNSQQIKSERSTESTTSVDASSVAIASTIPTTAKKICEDVKTTAWHLLPRKSRLKYVRTYDKFVAWKNDEKIDKEGFSREVMLKYFNYMKPKYQPTSLWAEYSMLRTTIQKNDNVDISYPDLKAFLRTTSSGYLPQKCNIFQPDDILRFLSEADDNEYLAVKVIMIFGIYGVSKADELTKIDVNDVIEQGSEIAIKIPDTKTNVIRSCTLDNKFAAYLRKYKNLRPENTDHKRFFLHYENGKCTTIPIGKKKMKYTLSHKALAHFLNLEDADNYGNHSFRDTYKKLLADCGGDILTTQHHDGWSSSTAVDGCVEEPIGNIRFNDHISEQVNFKRSTIPNTSTVTSSMDTSAFSNVSTIPTTFETYHVQPHQVEHPVLYLPFGTSSHN